MRARFEEELKKLNDGLVEMGILLEKALGRLDDLLRSQDKETLDDIRGIETRVDEFEHDIQSRCIRILFTQQPVARDLRSITAALNMITDMERIADQVCDIGEIVLYFKGKTMIKEPETIREMIGKSTAMVRRAVDAYVAQDKDLAQDVIDADDEVDALFRTVRDDLALLICESKEVGEQTLDFLMIAKYLERIADHAVNIAEWVIFNITGERKNERLM